MAIIRKRDPNSKSKYKNKPEEVPEVIQPGEVINNRYRVVRKLGRGGMGMVFLVEDQWKEGLQLALKMVRKAAEQAGADADVELLIKCSLAG